MFFAAVFAFAILLSIAQGLVNALGIDDMDPFASVAANPIPVAIVSLLGLWLLLLVWRSPRRRAWARRVEREHRRLALHRMQDEAYRQHNGEDPPERDGLWGFPMGVWDWWRAHGERRELGEIWLRRVEEEEQEAATWRSARTRSPTPPPTPSRPRLDPVLHEIGCGCSTCRQGR